MARITFTLLAALFLITACAAGPTNEELYDAAYQCQQSGADCDEEWDAWNEAEEALLDRQRRRDFGRQCEAFGPQYLLFCDGQTVDQCYDMVVKGKEGRCRCQCVLREGIWHFSN